MGREEWEGAVFAVSVEKPRAGGQSPLWAQVCENARLAVIGAHGACISLCP